jgi:hypothetical protein
LSLRPILAQFVIILALYIEHNFCKQVNKEYMKNWYTRILILAMVVGYSTADAQNVLMNWDFDGDLQGWTSNTLSLDSVWQWSSDGDATQGAFAIPNITLNSPTVSNGCVRFNSDFYTTGGDPANAPSGPPETYPKYICELISPMVDLSGESGAASLRFSQVMRPLNLSPGGTFRTAFSVSNDGGLTWSDPVDCNANIPVNAGAAQLENGTVTFPITDVIGSSQVMVKFIYAMDFYYWLIDDVQIISRQDLDMQANTNFYAVPHNARTPIRHVENMRFLSDIENVGGVDANNVNLNVSIVNSQGAEVYTADKSYGTLGIDSIAENEIFGEFTPAQTADIYTGTYTVSADGTDANPDNNTIDFGFAVTSDMFSKDFGPTRSIAAAADNTFNYGCHYIANHEGMRATSVEMGLTFNAADRGNANGRSVTIWLYEWNDENEDAVSQESERIPRGIGVYDINGTENWRNDGVFNVDLEPFLDPEDLNLTMGTRYLAMIEYLDDPAVPVTCFFAASDAIDYSAMVFLQDSLNDPRYAGFLDVGGTGEYSSLGFGYDLVPVAGLNVVPGVGSDDIELADNVLSIFPNPADHIMNVALSLDNASDVELMVLSVDGKLIFRDRLEDVSSTTVNYNVSNLINGNYLLRISTNEGFKSKPFTVQR